MRAKNNRTPLAFTLVELILVMALLVVALALSAPSLSRTFAHQALKQEALRLLALTEYARDEAVSQGMPVEVWLDITQGRFGARVKAGFAGDDAREKEFTLNEKLRFLVDDAKPDKEGVTTMTEFSPEGAASLESLSLVRIADRKDAEMHVVKRDDDWGYSIAKEAQ